MQLKQRCMHMCVCACVCVCVILSLTRTHWCGLQEFKKMIPVCFGDEQETETWVCVCVCMCVDVYLTYYGRKHTQLHARARHTCGRTRTHAHTHIHAQGPVDSQYTYKSQSELGGTYYWGMAEWYDGGGYVQVK